MCRLHIETSARCRAIGSEIATIAPHRPPRRRRRAALHGLVSLMLAGGGARAEPLRVVTSTPELGSLVREVGGERVQVMVLARPSEDPHFVEAKPSFVKAMNEADLYVANGLDLELGYQSVLLTGARNERIM